MKSFLLKNQGLWLLGVIIIFAIIIFISFFTFSGEPQSETPTSTPIPTPSFNPASLNADQPIEGGRYQYATAEDERILKEDARVGTFISELPYLGQYVRVDYSYTENKFTVRMDPDNIPQAENEYNTLLIDKGIAERIKVYNVEVFKQP